MQAHLPTKENIEKAARIIKSGGLVAFPTETVYGLGADAFNPEACARIFEAKKRPFFDPLIVHIAVKNQLELLTNSVPPAVEKLMTAFWPGPLTIVLDKAPQVPDIVTSGLSTVAVRMPNNTIAHQLLDAAGTPIAAPSANTFSSLSPTTAEHVMHQLGDDIDMLIDGGECEIGVESTIIKIQDSKAVLLRPGGVPIEELTSLIDIIPLTCNTMAKPEVPGQLPYHYAPSTPVKILPREEIDFSDKKAAYLLFTNPAPFSQERSRVLSEKGDLREAAANLFSFLHLLDKLNATVIIAEPVPEIGLGMAIMDRLRKAAKKHSG